MKNTGNQNVLTFKEFLIFAALKAAAIALAVALASLTTGGFYN